MLFFATERHFRLYKKALLDPSYTSKDGPPGFLIWKMLGDLRIIFCVHKVIRNIPNVLVRFLVAYYDL